jgi:predicted GIY-YIG superfamily endonuclease
MMAIGKSKTDEPVEFTVFMPEFLRVLRGEKSSSDVVELSPKKPQSDIKGGILYVIENLDRPGLYKIGITKDLNKRIAHLRTGTPDRLEVYHVIRTEYYAELERYLHRTLKAKNKRGEWFWLDDNDLDVIKAIKVVDGQLHYQSPATRPGND